MISRQSAIAWLAILLVLCSISLYSIKTHWKIQTDILALLPQDEQEPTIQTIRRMVSGELGRTVLFLVSHPQSQSARQATQQLGQLMDSSSLFTEVQWDYSQQPKAFFEFYFPFRYQIVSPTFRMYLDKEDGYQDLLSHLKRELYQPMSVVSTRLLEDDPLLFFPELMKNFGTNIAQLGRSQGMKASATGGNGALDWENTTGNAETNIAIEEGMIGTTHEGRRYYFIIAQLASNPFEEDTQNQLEENWQGWSRQLRNTNHDLELTYTAVARFASSMRSHMQKDMFLVSIGSTLGVILLITFMFHSIKHLFIAFIPLVIGLWVALGFSLLIFRELHAFTLVFGSTLIGVCVDYSMHYFAHHRIILNWEPIAVMRKIYPAIGLGALTTILSYIALGFTPLVGLRQMAFFASCGIIVSFLTVVFWYPFFLPSAHPLASHIPKIYYGLKIFLSLWEYRKYSVYIFLVILSVFIIKGFFDIRMSDNPTIFRTFPKDLVNQDRFIRDMMGLSEAQRYLIIEGKTSEEALQRLEQFKDYVDAKSEEDLEIFGPIISLFLPSIRRQKENLNSVRKLLAYEVEISQELTTLGFPQQSIEDFFRDLRKEPESFLLPSAWLYNSVSIGLRSFWLGHTADGTSIVVKLQNGADVQGMRDLLSPFEGIRYFDYMGDFSRILERYRKDITFLVIGAYVVIFALLLWRYRLQGFFVMLPPLLGACITMGFLGLFGQTIHLLHCLSLILVLGMGVDYAIFLVESDPSSQPTTLLASTLATVTTILSFGLLSLSSQEALRAIGVTTLLGIFWVWLLSPLAMYRHSRP